MKLKEFLFKFKELLKYEILPGFMGTNNDYFLYNGITQELHKLYIATNTTLTIYDIEQDSDILSKLEDALATCKHLFLFEADKVFENWRRVSVSNEVKRILDLLNDNIKKYSKNIVLTNEEYRKDIVYHLYNQIFIDDEAIYCFHLLGMLDDYLYGDCKFIKVLKGRNDLIKQLDASLRILHKHLDDGTKESIDKLLSTGFLDRHRYVSDYYLNMSVIQDTVRIPFSVIESYENKQVKKIKIF